MDPTCNTLRTDRSYIYEKFIECDNEQDIKVCAIQDASSPPTHGFECESIIFPYFIN